MNAPEKCKLPDIQAQVDKRLQSIDRVGVKGVRYPISIRSGHTELPTIADISMSVGLSAVVKGTHMSRFLEILEARSGALSQEALVQMAADMLPRLQAQTGEIEMSFPYFVRKTAPVSGAISLIDVDVCWRAVVKADGSQTFFTQVKVPATSLCPCSKEISEYGAHNQRSIICIEAELTKTLGIEALVGIAEQSASCEVYGLLKRIDEKFVTEKAYDNPKFVEDIVRDVALALTNQEGVRHFSVEVENFESIHNHSAFACISRLSPR